MNECSYKKKENRSNFVSTFDYVDEIYDTKTTIHDFQQKNINRIDKLIKRQFKIAN